MKIKSKEKVDALIEQFKALNKKNIKNSKFSDFDLNKSIINELFFFNKRLPSNINEITDEITKIIASCYDDIVVNDSDVDYYIKVNDIDDMIDMIRSILVVNKSFIDLLMIDSDNEAFDYFTICVVFDMCLNK